MACYLKLCSSVAVTGFFLVFDAEDNSGPQTESHL